MAAREIVNYIIGIGGDAKRQVDDLANSVAKLGQNAKTTAKTFADDLAGSAKKLNQNQLISQFETLSSLLIQVGGNVSQLGIFMSSAARPVALLGTVLGPSSLLVLGLLAIPAAAGAAAIGIKKIADAGKDAYDELVKLRRLDLIDAGVAQQLTEYEKIKQNFQAEKAATTARIGAEAAPAAGGLMSTLGLLISSGDEGAQARSGLLNAFGESQGAAGVVAFFAKASQYQEESLDAMQARADLERQLELATREAEQNEKTRQENENRSGSAIVAAKAERERIEKERLAAAKQLLQKEEQYRDMLVRGIDAEIRFAEELKREREKAEEEQRKAQSEYIKRQLEQRTQEELDAALQNMRDAQERDRLAEEEAARQASVRAVGIAPIYDENGNVVATHMRAGRDPAYDARMFDAAAMATGGADVGSIVASAGGGPLGAVFGAVADGTAYDSLESLFNQVSTIYTDLPEQFGKIMGQLVPDMIRAAPEMAAGFITLAPAIVAEMIAAGPELYQAVIDALLDLPRAFAEAMLEIANPLGILKNADADSGGGRTVGGAAAGSAVGFAVGGPLGALAGAAIGGAIGNATRGDGRGANSSRTQNIYISSPNPRDYARQLRQIQGSYGYGEDLDPVVF